MMIVVIDCEAERRIRFPNHVIHRSFCDTAGFLTWWASQSPRPAILLFIHGSNPEADDEPTDTVDSIADTLLAGIALGVCRAGGAVCIFSGGSPACDIDAVNRCLTAAGEGMIDRLTILRQCDPPGDINWTLLGSASISPREAIGRLRVRAEGEQEYLVALSILCQGFLAVVSNELAVDDECLRLMGWNDFRSSSRGANISLVAHRDDVQRIDWWVFGVFDNSLDVGDKVRSEWSTRRSGDLDDVLALTKFLDLRLKSRDVDGPAEEVPMIPLDVVRKAFLAIARQLSS